MQHPGRFVVHPPRRVMVVGNAGSGKRQLTPVIAQALGLPLVMLEREYQKGGGATMPAEVWRARVSTFARDEYWIIETHDADTFGLVVGRADWLVWLDVPMAVCLARALRHMLARRDGKKRRLFDWSLLGRIWSFPVAVAPRIVAMVERERRSRTIFILHSRREVDTFIEKLPRVGGLAKDLEFGDAVAMSGAISHTEPRGMGFRFVV